MGDMLEITIKMKTIVRKPLMIKIIKLRLRNLDNCLLLLLLLLFDRNDYLKVYICLQLENDSPIPFSISFRSSSDTEHKRKKINLRGQTLG